MHGDKGHAEDDALTIVLVDVETGLWVGIPGEFVHPAITYQTG